MFKTALFNFLLIIIFWLVIICNTFSQNTIVVKARIKGTVIDSITHLPLEFSTVKLYNDNNDFVKGSIANIDGNFELIMNDRAKFFICISQVGYKKYCSKELSIKLNETIDLGYIFMQKETSILSEVVIKGKMNLFQNKGDKLVYNAKTDIGNKAGSATDVLRNTPMVTVDADGSVKLRGNSNIKVMINGIPSNIMAKNLKEALKSIPAGTIESIEVITTPSAKYEAEGAAGIINIITKKKMRGTNGSIDLTVGNLEQSMNTEISITKEKFNYNISLGLINEKERFVSEQNRISILNGTEIGKLLQNNHTTQRYMGANIEFSAEYQTDSTQKIGTSISFWNDRMPANNSLYGSFENLQNNLKYNQTSKQKFNFNLIDFALNYQKKFKRNKQELQLIGQFSKNAEKSNYKTNQINLTGQPNFAENGSNASKSNDLSFQTDYSHPLDKSGNSILETGIRYGRNTSASDYSVFNNVINEDLSRSDDMNYSQNILAAYLTSKFETKNKWVIRPGLRYEVTLIDGNLKNEEPSYKVSFDNWVPSILISKKVGEKHDFKLNYTERIRRPEIWDLNPYINASDPRSLSQGNPYLRPEITKLIEFGYNFNASSGLNLSNSLFFNSNKNGIDYITIADSSGISRTSPQNIASINRIGNNINIYFPINENWTISSDIEFYHVWFDSKALKVKNEANFYSIGINSSLTLPADFTIQIAADYNNGLATLQGKNSSYYTCRLSLGKELFKNKASFTVNINNPFRSNQQQKNYLTASTFNSLTTEKYYNRSFTVSFSWKFGGFQPNGRSNVSIPDTEIKKEGMKKRIPNRK